MVSRTKAAVTNKVEGASPLACPRLISAFIGKLDMHEPRAPALEFVQTLMTVRLLAVLVQLNNNYIG